MTYRIEFFQQGRSLGATPWDSGLDAAKKHADAHLKINKADFVRITDDLGVEKCSKRDGDAAWA